MTKQDMLVRRASHTDVNCYKLLPGNPEYVLINGLLQTYTVFIRDLLTICKAIS